MALSILAVVCGRFLSHSGPRSQEIGQSEVDKDETLSPKEAREGDPTDVLNLGSKVDLRKVGADTTSASREPILSPTETFGERTERLEKKMLNYAKAANWVKMYGELTAADLLAERKVMIQSIVDATMAEFDERFSSGQYEILSTDGSYRGGPADYNPYDVYQVRWLGNGVVAKSSLPEDGHDDIYKLRALGAWLSAVAMAKN